MPLEYSGYAAGPIRFDAEEGIFSGTVAGLKAVLHFQGTTSAELAQAFHDTVDDYIAWCAARGKQAKRPFKGRILARTAPGAAPQGGIARGGGRGQAEQMNFRPDR